MGRTCTRWSARDIELLKSYRAKGLNCSEIGKLIGRSSRSVQCKLWVLHIRTGRERRRMSADKEQWFMEHYPTMDTKEVATVMGMTMRQCNSLAAQLGVQKASQNVKWISSRRCKDYLKGAPIPEQHRVPKFSKYYAVADSVLDNEPFFPVIERNDDYDQRKFDAGRYFDNKRDAELFVMREQAKIKANMAEN